MRRPRAGDETLLLRSGGAGAPPGDTTVPCQELADGGPLGLPEAWKERLTRKAPRASSRRQDETERQKARPGADKTLRWRAERRHTFARRCDLNCNDAPLGAPSPRPVRGTKACPREGGEGRRRTRRRQEYGRSRLAFLSDATLSSSGQDEGEKYGYRPAGGRGRGARRLQRLRKSLGVERRARAQCFVSRRSAHHPLWR